MTVPLEKPPDVVSRRRFLTTAGLTGAALAAPLTGGEAQTLPRLARPDGPAERVATDEAYWERVAAQYRISDRVTNLEAGYWGMMPLPVLDEYLRHVERVNRESSVYARVSYGADLEAVRARVATFLGVSAAELAFTRSATESLQCLIAGYNRLKPGDAVLYADLDYPAMQNAMKWLAQRRGVRVVRIVIPEPASRENVIATYTTALEANPDVRLVLLTHLNNKTGLIVPVAAIAALARTRGADTIVDAAHSVGQTDISLADLGSDFVGFNLHKWIGAPVGVGVMYIRASRIADIDPMMGEDEQSSDRISSRVHTGTVNFAAFLTVPAAIDFHVAVGPKYKAARIRYLRDRWVTPARALGGIDVLTPDEPGMAAGITSFRLRDGTSRQANDRVVEELRTRHGVFTVRRSGLERGDCVRVTPALYNRPADVDRLVSGLKQLAGA